MAVKAISLGVGEGGGGALSADMSLFLEGFVVVVVFVVACLFVLHVEIFIAFNI